MSFSSPVFLFIFLPICLVIYGIADGRYKNLALLAASLAFFAWGQWFYLPLMLLIILVNYYLARKLEKARGQEGGSGGLLVLGVGFNLVMLVLFKFLVSYGEAWLSKAWPGGQAGWLIDNPLPLGLSYITFQVISYLLDVSNEACDSEPDFLNFALYVLLFPKIVTGPIVLYRDVAAELTSRQVTSQGIANGLRRFIQGLAKKVLIADQIARIVNPAFGLETPVFSTGIAWVVVVGYALQIYIDFSGYTDMAIGLGQAFGFHFAENFNFPYLSRSISEFWRRWHITLSSWFRDYVFYPLEFASRRGSRRLARWRQPLNILIVFLLTGLWHGITLNFTAWGLIHGAAIALETLGLGGWLKKTWPPIQHVYALAVILVSWVFFRSPTLSFALQLLERMAGSTRGVAPLDVAKTAPLPFVENSVWAAMAVGALLCLPVFPWLSSRWQRITGRYPALRFPAQVGLDLLLFALLLVSFAALSGNVYVESIYGNF
jgi:alginate O-acetyltransferase complex protein AlgI